MNAPESPKATETMLLVGDGLMGWELGLAKQL